MYVFRLHVRPGGGAASMADTFAYCLKEGLLGVGYRVEDLVATTDWEEYLSTAKPLYEKLNTCSYIRKWVSAGDLVWTRDPQGNYYLARVKSGWEYFTTEHSRGKKIDIGNVFRVDFQRLSLDEVPGKVVACFRASRAIQEIANSTAIEYSKFMWNKRAGAEVYDIDQAVQSVPDIFALLDSEEVEDLVFLYLQSQEWFVVPNSRKADTMRFEYEVIKPADGQHALVQVKTGNAPLRPADYETCAFSVILFQANDLYSGPTAANVKCIPKTTLKRFLETANWLPARYRRKMDMFSSM